MRFWKHSILAGLLALSTLTGCLGGAYIEPGGEIVVQSEPPPPRYEPAPYVEPGFFWVGGNWHWDGGRWVWLAGHRERIRRGAHWVPAHVERRGGGWVYHRGGWVR